MDTFKLLTIVFGAAGFWKLVELLLQYGIQRRLKKAEIRNLNTQANSLIIENYKLWAENMEKRLKDLEGKNALQRDRITELERYVDQLESEIKAYKKSRTQ